jgi:hypothetical protein
MKMGGIGSGGHNLRHGTVQGCRSLDVNAMHGAGGLQPSYLGGWEWWGGNGERIANIGLRADDSALTLNYRYRAHDGDWQDIEQRVPIDWTPCRFGGRRPWFTCACWSNGRYCGRRVAKLYLGGHLFACRHCYRLSYQSQRESSIGRALWIANKLRMKLGGRSGMASPLPDKPQGMHWTTFERLLDRIDAAEAMADLGLMEAFTKLAARIGALS